jgi:hypothetical protein
LFAVPLATPFDPVIEVSYRRQGVEPLNKRMAHRRRQPAGHHEQRFLPLSSLTHRRHTSLRACESHAHAGYDAMPAKPRRAMADAVREYFLHSFS